MNHKRTEKYNKTPDSVLLYRSTFIKYNNNYNNKNIIIIIIIIANKNNMPY